MTVIIKVDVNDRTVINKLNNINFKLPKDIENNGFEFAKLAQRNLRFQLTRNKTIWRKKIWNGTQARKVNKKVSTVVMPKEGIWLDRAKPHWVKLKRGRLIHRWALEKGNIFIKEIARREGSIYVKPHPFIDQALTKTQLSYRRILKNSLKKVVGD